MKISRASELSGISSDTLRYYERIGLLPPINRHDNGIRDFDDGDLRRIEFIKCMRSAGLPIEVLLEYFRLGELGDQTIDARKDILKEQRALLIERIEEMQQTLELLNFKIRTYEDAVLVKENEFILAAD